MSIHVTFAHIVTFWLHSHFMQQLKFLVGLSFDELIWFRPLWPVCVEHIERHIVKAQNELEFLTFPPKYYVGSIRIISDMKWSMFKSLESKITGHQLFKIHRYYCIRIFKLFVFFRLIFGDFNTLLQLLLQTTVNNNSATEFDRNYVCRPIFDTHWLHDDVTRSYYYYYICNKMHCYPRPRWPKCVGEKKIAHSHTHTRILTPPPITI